MFFHETFRFQSTTPSPPIFGVAVTFEDGMKKKVDPSSLSPSTHDKIIHKFDLTSKNPVFEHAQTMAQQRFVVPEGQFGSKPQDQRDEPHPSADFKDQSFESMAAHGGQAQLPVADGLHPMQRAADGARDEAPSPGADKLRRGDGRDRGAPNSNGDILHGPNTWDDSSGKDDPDPAPRVSSTHGSMPTRSRACEKDPEQAWSLPGVHSMRPGEEGPGDRLRGPHHQGAHPDLQTTTRNSESSRRESGSSHAKHTGLFSKLGHVLLTLIAVQFGASLQDFGKEDFGDNIYEEHGRNVESSTLFPRLSDLGRSGHGRYDGGCINEEPMQDDSLFEDGPNILKSGVRKRLKHSAQRALQNSEAAREIVAERAASSRWPRRPFNYDIVEIFGGTSMVSIRAAHHWNLKVLQPIDIRVGVDLPQRRERHWLLRKMDKWRPRLALVEYPCTPWSILQRNVNYRDDPQALERLQERDQPFLKLTEDIFHGQVRRGGHAMTENPATADSQHQPPIQRLRDTFYETTSCMCRFGMVGRKGLPLLKRVRWIATHKKFTDALDLQCQHDHQHEKAEGSNTSLSAQYPPKLADTICKAYLDVVAEEDFGAHHSWDPMEPRGAHYVDVNKEEPRWRPLFDEAAEILARKVQKDLFIEPSTALYQKISDVDVPDEGDSKLLVVIARNQVVDHHSFTLVFMLFRSGWFFCSEPFWFKLDFK